MTKSEKTLLFVSYHYPYLPGEYFIEEEMKYLADSFKRVVVFPARCLFWKPEEVREMPDGVELWNPRDVPLLKRVVWMACACLQAPVYLKQQNQDWGGRSDLPTVSYLMGFKTAVKAIMLARVLCWFGSKSNLSSDLIGYAYWRDFSSAALALCRDTLGLKKLYSRCHRVDIYSPFRWPNETIIHARTDGIFPVSADGKRFLEASKGLPGGKIEVHRLGVQIPEERSVASSDGIYRVVSCSNLVPVKRVELIADVIAKLPFPVEWTHIGDGPGDSAIQELVAGFDAEHTVAFKGRLSNQQVYEYYRTHPVDLFINLSESEGVPVSIMEALAHGVPVVATDVGGTAEIVDETVGSLVPIEVDCEQVCEGISQLRALEESGADVRSSARQRAELMCSSHENYLEFCERLLAE